MTDMMTFSFAVASKTLDPEVAELIRHETARQQKN